MKRISLAIISLLALTVRAQADGEASSRSFNLEQAQNYALEHNYILRDRQFEIEKAQKTILETASAYWPQIAANYDVTHNVIIQPIAFPAESAPFILGRPAPPGEEFVYANLGGGDWQNSWGLRADWFIGSYSNFLAKKASEVLKETRRLEREEAEIRVRVEVAQAFYQVLVLRESVRLLEQNLATLRKNLFETRQLYENGFVEEQDADQLELLVGNLENDLENAQRQEELAGMMLKFQMGLPLRENIALNGTLDEYMQQTEQKLMEIESLETESHIQQKLARAQHRASVLQYRNERADLFPTLSFNASYSNLYVTNDFDPVNWDTYWAPAAMIGGSLKWNLFTGLARNAQMQRAEIDVKRAEMALEMTESQVKLEYEQARSNFLYALENFRNARKNRGLSEKIRDRTRVKFREGISSSLELTQAENQFTETQNSYIRAVQNLLNAREELEKALGQKP